MFETGIVIAVGVFTLYICALAIFGSFRAMFSWRSCFCIIVGLILGILISFFTNNNKLATYIGFGIALAISYLLFYVFEVPCNLRSFFQGVGRVLRIIFIVLGIILATVLILAALGI